MGLAVANIAGGARLVYLVFSAVSKDTKLDALEDVFSRYLPPEAVTPSQPWKNKDVARILAPSQVRDEESSQRQGKSGLVTL
jgi:hypothetical protein